MKNITLLPASYKRKLAEQQKTARVITALRVGVVLVLVVCLVTMQMGNIFSSKTDKLNQEIQEMQSEIASYGEAVAMNERVAQQRELKDTASAGVPELDAILIEVSNSAPSLVGVTAIAVAYENGQGAGVISGKADTHGDVSQWIDTLQENPNLGNIRCSYTQLSTSEDAGITFELQFLVLAKG